MISFQPDFMQVSELPVFRDVLGWKVIVIVQDGLILSKLVVKPAGSWRGEQKVVVDESHPSLCASGGECQVEVETSKI
jgi:hypothetical protein